MASTLWPIVDCVLCVVGIYTIRRFLETKKRGAALPPGPPGIPLLGNVLDFPSSNNWITFTKWAEEYGDIVYLNMAGVPIIILNSTEAATALFEDKGLIYSDKPHLHFLMENVGLHDFPFLQPDGPPVRQFRRIIAQSIGTTASLKKYTSMIEMETRKFLRRILDKPSATGINGHLLKLAASVILDITYGYQVNEDEDAIVNFVKHTMDEFSEAAVPGAQLVDTFPWLDYLPSWFPGMGYRDKATRLRNLLDGLVNKPYQDALRKIASETARPSVIADHSVKDISEKQETILKWTATAMYGGGADTTVSFLYHLFLFMAQNPDAQRKAQVEIDGVTGGSRLPLLSDRSALPYVDALIKELLRCAVVAPQGNARQLQNHDVYRGYFIPAKAVVIPNIWYMLHNPNKYRNPHLFDPDRFLGPTPEPDPREVWGFGRRICPGRYLAQDTLFVTCSMILSILNISKATDDKGNIIEPTVKNWHGFLVTQPEFFECRVAARSDHAQALVLAETDH